MKPLNLHYDKGQWRGPHPNPYGLFLLKTSTLQTVKLALQLPLYTLLQLLYTLITLQDRKALITLINTIINRANDGKY